MHFLSGQLIWDQPGINGLFLHLQQLVLIKVCGCLVTKPLFELMNEGYQSSNSPPQVLTWGSAG